MIRTDIITERRELHPQGLLGVEFSEQKRGLVTTKCVTVKDKTAAHALNTPCGKYFTVEFDDPQIIKDAADIKKSIVSSLSSLMNFNIKNILIIGLGNRAVTPDSLGPAICDRIIATRHITYSPFIKEAYGDISEVSVLAAGVVSDTGIDSAELALAAVKQVNPSAVIIVDALAARRPQRLCKTIQLSNVGITPGSGYDGARPAISQAVLGVPVVSVGATTVVDSNTYRLDCGGEELTDELMLTPICIDRLIRSLSELIAESINEFLGTSKLI